MEKLSVLINETKLQKRVNELAKQIMKDYKDKDIVFVCVLKGAVFFAVDLAKKIKNNVEFEFLEVASYEGKESTGNIKLNKDLKKSIKGKEVLIVEDIIDTGRTLNYLIGHLLLKKPASLSICTLLSKPSKRIIELDVNYVGFSINDEFVVGYGLDLDQRYRNLPYIGSIE